MSFDNFKRQQKLKMPSSMEYKLIQSFQNKSNDSFIKNFSTEKMWDEYEWSLRMYWLNNKDKFAYEELMPMLSKEIAKYFELEKKKK